MIAIVIACGLLIGLALYFLARSLYRMSQGRCCEGCGSCPQKAACEERDGPKERGEMDGRR